VLCEPSCGNSGPATAVVQVVPAKADAAPRSTLTTAPRPQVLSSESYIADGAQFSLEAMPPESFGPKNNEPSGQDRTAEHYPQRSKR